MGNGERGPAAAAELERLARQYWNAWQAALERTMPGAPAGVMPGLGPAGGFAGFGDTGAPWRGLLDGWMRFAVPTSSNGDDPLAHLRGQAGPWFELAQRLATGVAGRDATPEAVVEAWRDLLGGASANPFAQMLGDVQGPGLEGWETWTRRLAPFFEAVSGGSPDDGPLPTMGLTREHQARWQHLARAVGDYQRSQQAFHALLLQASRGAFVQFERRLRERDPAQPVDSARALFDLWIDAAEDAYAEVALSPPFRSAYAEMVGGQMRLRQAVQAEIEQVCRQFDLPTRSELDGAHRKTAELERALRRLRDRLDTLEAATSGGTASGPRGEAPATGDAASSSPGRAKAARRPAPRTARENAGAGATRAAATPALAEGTKARRATQAAATTSRTTKRATKRKSSDAPKAATGRATKPATKRVSKAATKRATKQAGSSGRAATARTRGAVPAGTATAAATSRRDAVADTRPAPRRTSRGERPARAVAPAPARVATLPNLGFVSPIPQAPEPLTARKSGRRKR